MLPLSLGCDGCCDWVLVCMVIAAELDGDGGRVRSITLWLSAGITSVTPSTDGSTDTRVITVNIISYK